MFHVLAVDFGNFGDVGTFGKILSTITKPRTKFLVLLGIETVEARNYCKFLNPWADLVEIHNEETNTFLHSIIKEKSFDYWWIGGSDEKEVSDNHLQFLLQV